MKGQYAKDQFLRLWDVFFLGPFLIHTGLRKSNLPKEVKAILNVSGALIILFNGRNFIMNELDKKSGHLTIKQTGIFQALITRQ